MKNALTINKVSKFIKRLFKIVSEDSFNDIVWTEDGKAIRITNKDGFMKNSLPYLSKTREYSAFIRQLNLYGFFKVKSGNPNYEEYFHPSFQRGKEDLLQHVKHDKDKSIAVYENKKYLTDIDPIYKEALECLSLRNYKLETEVCSLKNRVDKQENTINGLIEILSRMFQCSKPDESTMKIMSNKQNFENLRLNHSENGYQDITNQETTINPMFDLPDSQNIYQLARRNFEIDNKSSNQISKAEEFENKSIENHRALRNEIFGESDDLDDSLFDDNFF